MKNHVFVNHCIDFESILAEPKLDNMLKVAFKQSKTDGAKLRVDFANYKDYGQDQWCPAYFGMFVEWLAWHFFNHYGRLFNVEGCEMTDSVDSSLEDYGTDGRMRSIKDQLFTKTCRKTVKGSPVYLQVKGTMNKTKEYTPNDGSRLPNFCTNAMSDAIRQGKAYQARYIIFTTGKSVHYSLDKMSNDMLEVVNYKIINGLLKDDYVFLNLLRSSVGLTEFPLDTSALDPEAELVRAEIASNPVENQ
jgi:hypothetical protein